MGGIFERDEDPTTIVVVLHSRTQSRLGLEMHYFPRPLTTSFAIYFHARFLASTLARNLDGTERQALRAGLYYDQIISCFIRFV
jgi:hypothetical protein